MTKIRYEVEVQPKKYSGFSNICKNKKEAQKAKSSFKQIFKGADIKIKKIKMGKNY